MEVRPQIQEELSSFYKNKNVYVTGGAGFIGSHVVNLLLNYDANVTVVDNLERGRAVNIPKSVPIICVDLRDSRNDLPMLFSEAEVIIHMASKVANIEFNSRNHYSMYKENVILNTNVIDAAKILRPERFTFVSTSCVYPGDCTIPTPESDAMNKGMPEETNYGYGLAKWMGEEQCRMMHRETLQPATIVRFWNAYGKRDYFDEGSSHVIPALIKKIFDGQNPVVVWGTGKQTRTFVHANDLSWCLLALTMKKFDADVVQIGHDQEVSMFDLCKKLKEATEVNFDIVTDTSKPDGYARRVCDPTKLSNTLGVKLPIVPFEVGLKETVAWYKKFRNI